MKIERSANRSSLDGSLKLHRCCSCLTGFSFRSFLCSLSWSLLFGILCLSIRSLFSLPSLLFLCSLAISLLATSLKLLVEAVEVLLEVSGGLDRDLERWLRLGLDLDYINVAPGRKNIDNLSQLGHASVLITMQLQVLMLLGIEHVLDDAHVVRDTKA